MKRKSLAKLEALYKRIPKVECKGLCHQSCTLIPAADIESKRAKERLHYNPFQPAKDAMEITKTGKIPSCRALKDNRCSIYHIRPAICRLYAAAEGLDCPFGCQPKEAKISKQEAYNLIREIEAL
jgi:Fe-S-cluster containining protein